MTIYLLSLQYYNMTPIEIPCLWDEPIVWYLFVFFSILYSINFYFTNNELRL